jgi:V8-like Glu-specific endopeptidase
MVHLEGADFRELVKLLVRHPMLADPRGRASLLVLAGLEELIPQLDLSGATAVVVPLLVDQLARYGRVTFDHEALGRLLAATGDTVGPQDRQFLDQLIERYSLMVPNADVVEVDDWKSPISKADVLEKIVGENTLRPIAFLDLALAASKPVCFVSVTDGARVWSGSGFAISPRLVLTNHHVMPHQGLRAGAVFRFNYQLDAHGNAAPYVDHSATPNGFFQADKELDYAVVEVDRSPGDVWGALTLTRRLPDRGVRVNVIQHPNGLPKQISMQNNFVQYADPRRVQYVTSTLPGSSGAPVFSDDWAVVALHHAGGWLREGDAGPYHFRNEGIAIGAIIDALPPDIVRELTII